MSGFEIFLVISGCLIPFISILFVFKFKKKEKKEVKEPTKTYEEIKKEEPTPKVEEKKEPVYINNDISTDEFKSYLNRRPKTFSKPSRIELPEGFEDRTTPFVPRRRHIADEKPKTVAEEIRSLSPKVKALLFTGALTKKDYDE